MIKFIIHLVIETEQEARGEQGQQAAIKHLGNQDHVGPVNWNGNSDFQVWKYTSKEHKEGCKNKSNVKSL